MDISAVVAALREKVGFDCVRSSLDGTNARLIGRIPQDRMPDQLALLEHLFALSSGYPWSVDVSKIYFLADGRVVYAWRFIFETQEDVMPYAKIINVIETSRRPSQPAGGGPLKEVPLPGGSPHRHDFLKANNSALSRRAAILR